MSAKKSILPAAPMAAMKLPIRKDKAVNKSYVDAVRERLKEARRENEADEADPDVIGSSLSDIPVLLNALSDYERAETAATGAIKEFFEKHKVWTDDKYFPDLLHHFIREADRVVLGSESAYKRLVDDMLIYLRALVIITEMVGNAGTHAEKAARLRGLVEALESSIERVQKEQFSIVERWWHSTPDLFRSDYPVREYRQRIYQLEEELNRFKANGNGHSQPETSAHSEF